MSSLVYRDVIENARMPELARRYFCAALVAEAAEQRDAPVVHGVRADMLRRAGRFDEALAAAGLGDDDATTGASTVLAYIAELAASGDDEPHSVTEAFAEDD